MAAPAYTEDLTDIDLAQGGVTGYLQINFAGGGGGSLGNGPDFSMQGSDCIDRQVSNNERGIMFNNASGIAGAEGSGVHVFVWGYVATPGITDNIATRGAYVILGTGTGALCQYHVEGIDTYGAGGRVGKCYAIDYSVRTANTGSSPYRTLTGTPAASPQYFGFGIKTTGTAKAANMGLDAQRFGTGAYITAGDSGDPATFDGFATQNDLVANRWGILIKLGASYELQGHFVVGQNNAGTPTQAYFEDSDVDIVLVDTVHSATDFTRFIFDHASTIGKWTNVNITALGTNNKGYLDVIPTGLAFDIVGGTFSGFGTTTLRDSCTATGRTWRSSDQIDLIGGATLDSCNVELSSNASAVKTTDLADITDCNFIGDDTGHAVELSSVGGGSMAWDNTFDTTTYATADGSTGNETIYVNVGSGTLTINVGSGYTTPTIRTAGATVTVVSGQATLTVTCKDSNTKAAIEGAAVTVLAATGGPFPFEDTVTITRSGSTATVTHTAHGLETNNKVRIADAVQNEYNRVKQITVTDANTYTFTVEGSPTTPATGTILATAVLIDGETNASGVISDTRTYNSNQPVTGSAKKGSSEPVYITAPLVDTVDSGNGLSVTLLMLPD